MIMTELKEYNELSPNERDSMVISMAEAMCVWVANINVDLKLNS